jgi:hypothetical protein
VNRDGPSATGYNLIDNFVGLNFAGGEVHRNGVSALSRESGNRRANPATRAGYDECARFVFVSHEFKKENRTAKSAKS